MARSPLRLEALASHHSIGDFSSGDPAIGGYLLGRLGVDHRYQGRGIGQALVAVAVAQARHGRAGTGGVYIAVDAKNDRLVAWYERLGFARLGRHTLRLVMRL